MDLTDPTTVALAVAKALEGASLHAAVYGGLALAAFGVPRETRDADFAVAGVSVPAVVEALDRGGFDTSVSFQEVRFGGNVVSRIALLGAPEATGLNTLDLVEPRSPRYARVVLGRALTGTLRDQAVTVVSPEDFVLLKILSTRARDLEDASSVIRTLSSRIDVEKVRAEAEELAAEIPDHDIVARLEQVLA